MKRFAALVSLLIAAVALPAQTIKVNVQNLVGLDENFNVTFSVEGSGNVTDFEWSPGSDFQLVWGPSVSTSSSFRSVNGVSSMTTQKSWTYVLKPLKTGTFAIASASAKVDGSPVHSAVTNVQVIANGASGSSGNSSSSSQQGGRPSIQSQGSANPQSQVSSDDIFLRLAVGKRSAVVGEPINVTLKLYSRVQITGFDDLKLPVFNGFWSQELDNITQLNFQRESYNDMLYSAAVIRNYVIIPQKSGTLTIDPAELVCLVAVHNTSYGNSIFDSLFDDYSEVRRRLTTPLVNIEVSPLPAGAPASFSGAVGSYKMKASLTKDEIKANDASTLKITVSGNGNLSLLDAPEVSFPLDFEAYDVESTSKTSRGGTSGEKTFEIPFIARSEGEYTIGPIEFSYYDTATKRYETLRSEPLPITVLRGSGQAALSGGSDTAPSTPVQNEVQSLGEDIRFIATSAPGLIPAGKFIVTRGWFWGLLAGMVLASLAFLLIRRIVLGKRADVQATRSRQATKMALKRLSLAKSYLSKNQRSEFYTELHSALNGFAADRLSLDMTDMSKDNIAAELASRGVSEESVAEFTALLDACEFARYAPSGESEEMKSHYDKAVNVISSIATNIRKGRKGSAALMLIPLMLFGGVNLQAQEPADLWASGIAAYQEGRYADALDAWNSILASGEESSLLHYNIGNAHWRLGDKAEAILGYERALALDPSFDDARDNLAYANARITDSFNPDSEFFLVTFFRKCCYLLPSDTWAWLAAVALALALALLVVFLTSGRRGWKIGGFFGGILALLLFALTLYFALWQHSDYSGKDYGIIMPPVISVKSSPAADSQDLFLLHEGTKVKYLGGSVDGWSEISIPDGRKGWIQTSDSEVI